MIARLICAGGLALALATALSLPLSRLAFDNDLWLAPDHPQEIALDDLADRFAPGETLVIAARFPSASGGGAIKEKPLQLLRGLEKSLEENLGADLISMRSTLTSQRISAYEDVVQVETFDEALARGAFQNLAAFRRAFDDSPYGGRLLSSDGDIAALRLRLDTREQSERRSRVMSEVEATLAASPLERDALHLIGPAPLKDALNRASYEELPQILLAALIAMAIFLRLAVGSFFRALPILFLATLSALLLFDMMLLLGHSVTIIALALPVLLSVIAVADALHILAHYDSIRGERPDAPLMTLFRMTGSRIWLPCLLTSMTSAIGFGAFAVSDLIPLERFGTASFIAIALLYPSALTVSAASLYFFRERLAARRAARVPPIIPRFLEICDRWTRERSLSVVGASLALSFSLALGLFYMRAETNFLSVFFDEESQIRKDFALADKRLGGSGSVDIMARGAPRYFESREALEQTLAQKDALIENPDIFHIEHYGVALREAHRALSGEDGYPLERDLLAQELLFLELSRSENRDDVLSPYADFTYETARLHLSTPDLTSEEMRVMLADLRERMAPLHEGVEIVWTGFGVFVHELSLHVLTTQFQSLALTIALIGLIFFARFGAFQGSLGLAANVAPVSATMGAMAWLSIPFDFATVLIAGVALGLCVDDTLHFLHAYNRRRREGGSPDAARTHAIMLCGRPIVITSLLFSLGFAILLTSTLVVLERFAIFTILGLSLALFSSLFFLPALLALFEKAR